MKIEVNDQGELVIKEAFNSIILQTEENNQFAICMRDDTVEMSVAGSNKVYRANMDTGDIEAL